ncbi:MAG TPA: pyruvate synthase [Candidatus Caldiarchaeum subterraneum]|uniref:Pyruvate synthase n=1 Tax=Caldiarchaeum subterraneum TaxID=311458 RepID=A0A832ZX23_CALS0|nr:pyruvate synthase [Candidatus Caldarchaeum subterraneum]
MSEQTSFKTLRDTPISEYLTPGSPLCGGCGGEIIVKLALKALGPKTILVSVPGCLALFELYPYTSLKTPMLFAPFPAGPAAAQGIVDGIEALVSKGRVSNPGVKVLLLTGDGAAYDIGLQATSAAIHRGLDFYYLCYDNEAYGNTGFQFSGSTPLAASTSTTPAGSGLRKKDLFEIWRAHNPPYVATVAASRPVDLLRKFEKAQRFRGPKLFIALGVCPTGWGSDPALTVRLDKLAVETGIFPLKEAVYGRVRHTYIPRSRKPVEEYLRHQRRFEHLFKPVRRDDLIRQIQEDVDRYWENVRE